MSLIAQRECRLPTRSHSKEGKMDDREGGKELDGQAAPHWLLGVLGGSGLSCCVGKLKERTGGLLGLQSQYGDTAEARSYEVNGEVVRPPGPSTPVSCRAKQRQHAV